MTVQTAILFVIISSKNYLGGGEAMDIEWVDGYEIHVKIDHGAAVIAANKEGLLSLAKQLTALAEAAPGQHIHYDDYNCLEEGSAEMIIVKAK